MSLLGIAIVFIGLMFVLFIIGFEIGFAMCLIGFLGFAYIVDLQAALNLLSIDVFNVFASYGFTVIPLFVLMGQIAFQAGISRKLYDAAYRFVGHVPGGLAIATVVGAAAFGTITGSAPATAATFAGVAIPEMDRYGYSKKLSTGTVASSGILGAFIPPSIFLIIYGILAEQSIGRLFLACIIPGLLITSSFAVAIIGLCKNNTKLGPKGGRSTWKGRLEALPSVIPAIGIFVIVVGGMMQGYFTPTEAGRVGAFAVLILSLTKKDVNLKGFIKSIFDSLNIACMVLMLIAGGTVLGHFFAVTNITFATVDWLSSLALRRELIMLIIFLIILIGGSVIDDLAFLILIIPILLPLVNKLGYDLIWFGIVMQAVMMLGIIIPPIAVNVFVVSSVAKVPLATVYRGAAPFSVVMAIWVVILLIFPQISLWLPNLLMK